MKMVSAVIKHFRLDDVRKGLTDIGVERFLSDWRKLEESR